MLMKRSMRLSSKFDLIFVVAIVAAFLVCAWLLYAESRGTPTSPNTEIVGTITYKNRVTERKAKGEVVWGGLVQNASLHNSDTVRTSAGSSAVIHLKDNTEISLGEQTMILVSVAEKGTRIEVSGGLVAVRRVAPAWGGSASAMDRGRPGSGTLITISTRSGTVSLTSGSVSIGDSAAGAAVSVESGTVTINTGSSTKEIAPGSVVALGGSAQRAVPLVLLTPQAGQTLFAAEGSSKVSFTWTAGSGLNPPSGQLIVAADSDFTRIEYRRMVSGTSATQSFQEGTHYWKLSAQGTETPPRWFNTVALRPPKLLEPADNTTFNYAEAVPPVVGFSWLPLPFASSYRLEVYAGVVGERQVVSATTSLSSLALESLKEGDYHWRVVAQYGQDAVASASQTRGFSMKKTRLTVPEPVRADSSEAAESLVLSTVAIGNGALLACWGAVEGATQYEASVARDPEATDVVATVGTGSNFLRLEQPLDPGTYYVRIRAVSGTARSDASKAIAVRVVDPQPLRTLAPIDRLPLDPDEGNITFRWSDPNEGHKYRVILSPDSAFDHQLASFDATARQSRIPLPTDRSGTLFWKVELLDDSDGVVASSPPASFLVPQLLQDPEPIYPVNGEQVDVNANDFIRFRWNSVPGANEYRVTLYQMGGGLKSVIRSWGTDKTLVLLDSFVDLYSAPCAWTVRARSMKDEQLLGQSRTVLSYFRIVQSHPLAAPKNILLGAGNP
jgi:hypothetical protein